MKKLLTILLISTFAHLHISTLSQITFQKTYGGGGFEVAYEVQQTNDGGYILAGNTTSFGVPSHMYLIKIDSIGNTLWSGTYGGAPGGEVAYAMDQTTDGGYIVAGTTTSFGVPFVSGDVYLVKTDSDGVMDWSRNYGGGTHEQANAVEQTTDGGYIMAGWTQSFGVGLSDVYLIKTDSIGNTLWTRTYGRALKASSAEAVQQTTDGGYIVAGWTGVVLATHMYLIKTDANGDTLWTKTYRGASFPNDERAFAVEQTTDGGYILAGRTRNSGQLDVSLIKTDSLGDTLWTRSYGRVGISEMGYALDQTTDGGYIVTGHYWSFGTVSWDVYLIKTDSNGDTLWTKAYGGGGTEWIFAVQQTIDGGYIVAGATNSFGAGNNDVYLIKTDANGNSGCNEMGTQTIVSSGAIVSSIAAIVGSGGIVNSPPTVESSPSTIVNILCLPPIANFIASDTIVCEGDCINFFDLSTGSPISWQWSFPGGNPSFSTAQNPVNICYDTTGTYDVQLIAINANGPDTLLKTNYIQVDTCPPPTANFTATDTMICEGDCINFTDLSTDIPTSWQWSFPGAIPSSSTDQNPANICYDTAGTYDVTLIAANFNGSDTLTKIFYIVVDPSSTVDLGNDTAICAGDSLILDAGNPGFSYNWSTGDTTQTIIVDTSGIYWVIVSDTSGTCQDIDSMILTVIDSIVAVITPDASICEGDNIQLNASGGVNYFWSPSTGLSNPSIANPTASPTTTTTYQVIVSGCGNPDTAYVTITVTPNPLVNIGKDIIICSGDSIILDAGNPGASYLWSTGATTQTITIFGPGNYFVEVTDSNCTSIDMININVDACTKNILFIPNSFSPNGDGVNDVLFVRGSGIKNIKLFIYNRWGEKVFESWSLLSKYDIIKKGWDGTYKGKLLNPAVFAWYAEVEFEGGNKIYRKGNVTLLR